MFNTARAEIGNQNGEKMWVGYRRMVMALTAGFAIRWLFDHS